MLLFCSVALYIIQKRIAYFVPGALKPSALLSLLTGKDVLPAAGPQTMLPHAAVHPGPA